LHIHLFKLLRQIRCCRRRPPAPLEPRRVLDTISTGPFFGSAPVGPEFSVGLRLRWGAQSSYLTSASFDLSGRPDAVQCTVDVLLFQLPPSPDVPPPGTAPIYTSPAQSLALPSRNQQTTFMCGGMAAPPSLAWRACGHSRCCQCKIHGEDRHAKTACLLYRRPAVFHLCICTAAPPAGAGCRWAC
jgi:hypothetical protein